MKKDEHNCEDCEFYDDIEEAYFEHSSQVRVGEVIPDYEFEVFQNDEVKTMKFSDLLGKWGVFVFYPADFTFVCPTELEELAKLYPKFKEQGAEIISFSTDTVFVHKAWKDTSDGIRAIEYPMGADPSGKISSAFGTLIEGGESEFTPDEGLSLRGTFIVDPNGILRGMEISDNSVGRSASETFRKLQAMQYVEQNDGKVCPASWEPGDDDIEPGMDLVGKI
ncbi:MAG TPA: redoxin domain-containing protein [Candidatus Kaiserbacteria bacterium]|nr:redoxin domain-containing protein [Candidatus Kaiserbacteria bacterium]